MTARSTLNVRILVTPSAQCTAVQLRRQQQNREAEGDDTEPVVLNAGRRLAASGHDEVRPSAAMACLGGWAARYDFNSAWNRCTSIWRRSIESCSA